MNDKTGVEELIRRTYETLKAGEAAVALDFLGRALQRDFEHPEVLYALKCLKWWMERLKRLDDFQEPYGQGEYILSQWKPYYVFLDRLSEIASGETGQELALSERAPLPEQAVDSCQYAIKHFVFNRALACFSSLLEDGTNQQDPVLLLQTARCCKGAGYWDEAFKHLEKASRFKREDSAVISELADVHALLGDERTAKVLFREAFFIEPQEINLAGMESEMILALLSRIREMGYAEQELAEWVPVWGCVWGVFSYKRELKPVELGRLKQSILVLENENRSKSGGDPVIKPRLLNRYFWLIDHYEQNRDTTGNEGMGSKNDTMLKIQFIDPVVYEHYRS